MPPTLRQFVERAQLPKYGCVLKSMKGVGPEGPVEWKYLLRGDRIGVLPEIADDETLAPTKLRELIADLNLPGLEFWLRL